MEHIKQNKLLTGKLKDIAKTLSKQYSVKIGLLASHGGTKKVSDNLDLAGLGAVQEFGARIKVTDAMKGYFAHKFNIHLKKSTEYIEIPARSWLYEPIKHPSFRKLIYDYVGDTGLFEEYADKQILEELANIIGESGLMQIQKAFDDGGINHEWKPNSELTIANKGSSMPLVNNGDLRGQITFEVE